MSGSIPSYTAAAQAAKGIRNVLPEELQHPQLGVICGSGLGGLQHSVIRATDAPKYELAYEQIPGMPVPSVKGHEGKMVFGFMGQTRRRIPVVLLVGRAHYYEGHSLETVTFATRLLKCLDVHTLILTNAAGGLNPDHRTGDLMLISDHLNLAGLSGFHPLLGPNDDRFGPRFPPLSDAYDAGLRRRALKVWRRLQGLPGNAIGSFAQAQRENLTDSSRNGTSVITRRLHEGTYAYCCGPSYETRAEARMLRMLGADVVGMSTVPEVIVARHSGMRVLAASLVTNMVVLDAVMRGDDEAYAGLSEQQMEAKLGEGKASHEEVIQEGRKAAETMVALVQGLVEDIATS